MRENYIGTIQENSNGAMRENFTFISVGFSRSEVNLTWMSSPLEFDNRVHEPRHYLNDFHLDDCTETYLTGSVTAFC